MKKILQEFREFAIKGNMLDLAIGVIIGAAFGRIVSSMVDDLIMPPINLFLGQGGYAQAAIVLREAAPGQEAILWKYGHFFQTVLDFLIVAACIFMLVRVVNRFRRKEAEAPTPEPAPTREELLLMEIRDALKNR